MEKGLPGEPKNVTEEFMIDKSIMGKEIRSFKEGSNKIKKA
jgi:hypothetical protein